MADYKDIVGTTVRSNAGNLTSAKDGELFYDSTNLDFIYKNQNVTSAGAWRTGGNLNTGRFRSTRFKYSSWRRNCVTSSRFRNTIRNLRWSNLDRNK